MPEPKESEAAARHPANRRNKAKVLVVMLIAVFLAALGDVSLSRGMKAIGKTDFPSVWAGAVATMTSPYVLGGIGLLIGFLLLYLASLSWEDLSFVLPLTAASYVLVTLLAYFLLDEHVSELRWAGSVLVAAGIAVVART